MIHSLRAGGAEESLATAAVAARQVGVEIEVLSLVPLGDGAVARRLLAAGVPVASLDLPSRWDPRALPAAARLLRARAPDVLHAHLKHADLVCAYACRRAGIPMVSTLHVVEEDVHGLGRVKRAAGGWARKRSARLTIAVSDAQRQWYLTSLGADPASVVTVRNGVAEPEHVDEAARRGLREALGVGPDELMATTVALMRPGKGHEDVLDLAAAVGPGSGVRFVLVGDGELRSALERRAAERRVSSAPVVFAGFREDAPALLAASDLVVHPSHADALPTALLHAVAAGRPTLAYAVGGVPEIVTPEAGVLAAPFDREALLAGFGRLQASADLRARLGAGARARYEAEFTLDAWMLRLREVYERVVAA